MFFIRSKLTGSIERKLSERKYLSFLPLNHTLSDVFLVSFPKSGNTWLRFLVANAIKTHYQIEREVNFFTVHDIIPDIYLSKKLAPVGPFGRTDIPRIIKSHSAYNPFYFRVILLVRDPRDALISYYHYVREREGLPEGWTISEFIRCPKRGVAAWKQHTESWYLTLKQGQIIQVFLYEDLLKNPKSQLAQMMNCLGINMSDDELEQAIQLSSKEKMKASENTHRSTYLIKNQERPFVRQGKAQAGKELPETDRIFIEDSTREIAKLIGYHY